MTIPADMKAHNRQVIADFRAHGGPPAGRPLLLLTTTGARSGEPRTTPMMYVRLDDQLLVIASNAGAPRDPDWYRNLVADPAVTVELGPDTYPATAVVPPPAERDHLFTQVVAQYPFFAEHQTQTARPIPVVILKPSASEAGYEEGGDQEG